MCFTIKISLVVANLVYGYNAMKWLILQINYILFWLYEFCI